MITYYAFALFYLLGAFGLWTLLVWAGLLGDWSFRDLQDSAYWLAAPLLMLLALAWRVSRLCLQTLQTPARELMAPRLSAPFASRPLAWPVVSGLLLLPALLLTAPRSDGPFAIQWLLLCLSAAVLAWPILKPAGAPGTATPGHQPLPAKRGLLANDLLMFTVCTGLLITAYLFNANTDADDTHFLAAVMSLLKHPDALLFEVDVLFGDSGQFNHIYALNRGQSWEALVALLSTAWGVDHLDLYYAWLPILVLLLVPAPLLLLLKRYHPQFAWVGVLFALVFLLAWSTFNHHAGHFYVPRMFQGKSIFVTLLIPSVFLTTRLMVLRPSPAATATLMLVLVGSAGLTSSALYISLAAAGTAWLAHTRWQLRSLITGGLLLLLASIPNLLMLNHVYHYIKADHQLSNPAPAIHPVQPRSESATRRGALRPLPPPDTKNSSIYGQFGGGKLLATILLLFWLALAYTYFDARRHRSREVTMILLMVLLLTLNRPLSEWLAQLTGIGNVDWRLHWAMPISLVLGLLMAGALQLATQTQTSRSRYLPAIIRSTAAIPPLALAGLLVMNAGHLSRKYTNQVVMPKVFPEQQVMLEYFRKHDLSGRTILADTRVAQLLPRIQHEATLISAGRLYWEKPYFTAAERRIRHTLQSLVNARQALRPRQSTWLQRAIVARHIDLMIFARNTPAADSLAQVARDTDMHCSDYASWWICEGDR